MKVQKEKKGFFSAFLILLTFDTDNVVSDSFIV